MNTLDFTTLMATPSKIKKRHVADLEKILQEFPYFQSAWALLLKGLKDQDSFQYNKTLKKTAAYTTNRSVLFEFITSEAFRQHQISEQIKHNHEGLKMVNVIEFQDISNPKSSVDTNSEKTPESTLNLGRPLEFQKNETYSFSEWLKLTKIEPIDRSQEKKSISSRQQNNLQLIDAFIEKNPKIQPKAWPDSSLNLAEQTPTNDTPLMTETLAKIYLEQKNYSKAIQAYKILSLNYPEKSSLFADQIQAIKKLQVKNNNV